MRFQHQLFLLRQLFAARQLKFVASILLGVASFASTAQPMSPPPNSVLGSSKITWGSLTPAQKIALAPLASEWDGIEELPKRKWLGIANKYADMKPDEQQRIQDRLKTWVKLSPAQRMAVRENFSNTTKTPAAQKSAQWQLYQQLSEEEKRKLANTTKTKKNVTAIQPESKRTATVLAPLKKGPPPADGNALASHSINK